MKLARRENSRIYKALLRKPLRNRCLTTLESSFWFTIACAGFLALVTSSGRSSATRALTSTKAFLLPNKALENVALETTTMPTACCEFGPGERFESVIRAALERNTDDMSAKSRSLNSGCLLKFPRLPRVPCDCNFIFMFFSFIHPPTFLFAFPRS
jgi:hypothetical protein